MNFRRGFFRLWVLGSALFAAGVAVVSYDDVAQEFKRAKESREWKEVALILIPVHCKDARGQSGTDYEGREGPWSDFSTEGKCLYNMADFRRLYPEYNDLTDDVLTQKMYEKANRPLKAPAEPWWFLGQAISVAVIVPLFVLLLGSALAWALSGFAYGRAPS